MSTENKDVELVDKMPRGCLLRRGASNSWAWSIQQFSIEASSAIYYMNLMETASLAASQPTTLL